MSDPGGWLPGRGGRQLARWRRAAESAPAAPLRTIHRAAARARDLRPVLDAVIAAAEDRAAPDAGALPDGPSGTEWQWRPALWRHALPGGGAAAPGRRHGLGGEVTLFHDCPLAAISLRQMRGTEAPYACRLDVLDFAGSFLSLAVDLPPDGARELRKRHLVRLDTALDRERPQKMFARLNVRHGPNTAQLLRELPPGGDTAVEFDLAYTDVNEARVEAAWLDLIFEAPAMNRVTIGDLILSRRPRAGL